MKVVSRIEIYRLVKTLVENCRKFDLFGLTSKSLIVYTSGQ